MKRKNKLNVDLGDIAKVQVCQHSGTDSAVHLYSKHSPLSIPTGALNLTITLLECLFRHCCFSCFFLGKL